jgi:alpha,alpha-trehalose-phosphate synthase [UDP-forming]
MMKPHTPTASVAPLATTTPALAAAPASDDLVVVANRLPVTVTPTGEVVPSPGGLVSALSSLGGGPTHWIGWIGNADDDPNDDPNDDDSDEGDALPPGLHPVPLNASEIAAYYDGFCNSLLWPLFHGRLQPLEPKRTWWRAYRAVNHRFAATAATVAPANATVWVHDYHLLLVPAMLRARRRDVRIGVFLHIPFPPAQLFATLPWRRELLLGILGADLVGFQTPDDVANFDAALDRVVGTPERGHRTITDAFPISIDVRQWTELGDEVADAAVARRARLGDDVVFLGADRLDYTKGIAQRLRAFGELLDHGDLDADRARFVQIAVPSRDDIASYQDERDEVLRIIGEINGRHHRPDGTGPIHYIGQQLDAETLATWYRVADCLVVTSLADGMNLVAKEFVACRTDGIGSVVLSEFAGAANDLPGALIVNPYDIEALKRSLTQAATMSRVEQRDRMSTMREVVEANDLNRWASDYLGRLRSASPPAGTHRRAGSERRDRRGGR